MLGMTAIKNELDRSLRVLRRSRLMRHAEFKHMVDLVDRYRHDNSLAGLVRKDSQQLEQLAQDGQFFRILIRMLTEVSLTKGTTKQRDDLKKVYAWYLANRSGLHCLPRFSQSMRKLESQTILRFAPDVIAHYSSPRRQKRKETNTHVVKKEEDETAIQKVPEEKPGNEEKGKTVTERPSSQLTRTTGLKRPMTAPPTLYSSSKAPFGQMKGDDFVSSSFTGQFVSTTMVQTQKRPASAAGIMRMSTPDMSPYSHDMKVVKAASMKQHGISPRPNTASSIASSVSIDIPSVEEVRLRSPKRPQVIPKGMTVAQVINPTAQITFEDDNYDVTGSNPDSRASSPVKMLHISVPTEEAKESPRSARTASKDERSANLKAWEDYKQKQSYGQDFIGRLKFYGRTGTPYGIRYSSHEEADRPELYTEEVIANYAELSDGSVVTKATDEDNDRITYHSLENFYKETEKYCMDPSQKTQIAPVRVQSSMSTEPMTVYVPEELSQDSRIKSAMEELKKHPNVKFDAIVGLTEIVKENMEYDKEKLSPDPKYGHHQPAITVSRRPSTAPDRVMSTPVPPNSDRPSSASSVASSGSSSRNQKGEPVVMLPDKTDYTMHMRKESPQEANLGPQIKVSGKVKPDTVRYRRPESARKNLRTAGSVAGSTRPTTSMQTPRERWNAEKESDKNERINQAASHMTTEVDSEAVARMVLINHLGSEKARRARAHMGHRIGGSFPLDAELPKLPQTLQFVSFTGPAKIQVKGQPDTGRLPDAPPQSPKENNTDDAASVSSSRDFSLDSDMVSGRSSLLFNLDDTPRLEDAPHTRMQNGKVTPIEDFKLKGQAILPTGSIRQIGDLQYGGQRSAMTSRNLGTPSDAKTIDENIQNVWDANNAETAEDMENDLEDEIIWDGIHESDTTLANELGQYNQSKNDVVQKDIIDSVEFEKAKGQDCKDENPFKMCQEKPELPSSEEGAISATQKASRHGKNEGLVNQVDKDVTNKEIDQGDELPIKEKHDDEIYVNGSGKAEQAKNCDLTEKKTVEPAENGDITERVDKTAQSANIDDVTERDEKTTQPANNEDVTERDEQNAEPAKNDVKESVDKKAQPANIDDVTERDEKTTQPASDDDVTERDEKTTQPANNDDVTERDEKTTQPASDDVTKGYEKTTQPASDDVTERDEKTTQPANNDDVTESDEHIDTPTNKNDVTERDDESAPLAENDDVTGTVVKTMDKDVVNGSVNEQDRDNSCENTKTQQANSKETIENQKDRIEGSCS